MYKILFIGIGKMGYPMAGYLSNHHEISVYNRTKSKCYSWIKDYKGQVIDDLSSNKKKFDFIISCIGNDNDLKEITSPQKGCLNSCLLYTSPSPRDVEESRMPSSA